MCLIAGIPRQASFVGTNSVVHVRLVGYLDDDEEGERLRSWLKAWSQRMMEFDIWIMIC